MQTSRPSKDDLAALDALLDPRTLEGPLEPLERAPETRWTPPDRSVRARRSDPATWRRIGLIGGFLAVAAVGFAGVWYFALKPATGNGTDAATPTPPEATAAAVTVSTVPAALSTAAPVATPPPVRSPPVAATPAATRTPAPTTTSGTAGIGNARGLLRQGQLGEAARAFAAHLKSAPAGAASIQLFVACSAETVQKAVAAVDAPDLFILPVSYKGRDCFRLCWGVYESAAGATSATRSLPEYFLKGGATPRVMTRPELLP